MGGAYWVDRLQEKHPKNQVEMISRTKSLRIQNVPKGAHSEIPKFGNTVSYGVVTKVANLHPENGGDTRQNFIPNFGTFTSLRGVGAR